MMGDPMKEFREIINVFNELDFSGISNVQVRAGVEALVCAAQQRLSKAIWNYEKAHTEQNRPLSIDLGELDPEILKIQCGFGEKE